MDYFTFNGNEEQLRDFVKQIEVDQDCQDVFYDILLNVALKDNGQQDALNSGNKVELHIPRTLINIKISVVAIEIIKMLTKIALCPDIPTIIESIFECALIIYKEALDKLSDISYCIFDRLLKEVYNKKAMRIHRQSFFVAFRKEREAGCEKILPTKVKCTKQEGMQCLLSDSDYNSVLYELERKRLISLDAENIKVKL